MGSAAILWLIGCAVVTDPAIYLEKADFSQAKELRPLHRGINLWIAGENVQWDASIAPESDFFDVADDPLFRQTIKSLGVGSLRLIGGVESNYHDYTASETWVSWGIGADQRTNTRFSWTPFWNFWTAVGKPHLEATGNVYKTGNPELASWVSPQDQAAWAADIALRGAKGVHWEAGNETYIESTVPGMKFLDSAEYGYPARACKLASSLHAVDRETP
ncbi:MAG: hypothetical protein AAB425_02515, partial [Bdellovibrionota bacterium]